MPDLPKSWAGPAKPLSPDELADHHAVSRLCQIYALGMDMRDYPLARSAFADDAQIEGRDGMAPVDDGLASTFAIVSAFQATQHFIGNQYVDLAGDDATVWSYGVAHHKAPPGEGRDDIIAGVQYRDRCRRSPAGWLIVERTVAHQWMDFRKPG